MISTRLTQLFTGALLFAALNLLAADWPRWRGPAGDGHVPANMPVPEKLPAEPKTVWRFPIGDGYGSPVMAGGRVFILEKSEGKEMAHAVDAQTGQEVWKYALDEVYEDSQGKGPRSTPLVDGDRVYLQSCRGEFQCLNAATGKMLWRKNYTNDFGATFIGEKGQAQGATRHGNNGSPIIDGEHILIQAGGTNGASVVCLEKKTGEIVWKSQNDQAGYGAIIIETVAGVRQAISFTAEGVIGLDPKEGKLLWRFPIQTRFARHATTPVVSGDMAMVSSHEHGLYGIKITRQGNEFKAEQAWLNKAAAINFASPVVVEGYLYGVGPARNIMCVEVKTGEIVWSKDGYLTGPAGKAYAGILVMGKTMVILTDGGQLIQIAVDPKECREISRAQVSGTTWNIPAYADGKLFLRDTKNLLAVQIN